MKCTFQNSDFVKVLQDLFKVIPSKPSIPILGGILAKVEDGKLFLTASNTEVFLSTSIPVGPDAEKGTCVISAEKLKGIVDRIPQGSTVMELKDKSIVLSWSSGYSSLPVYDHNDFPTPPDISESYTIGNFLPTELLSALSCAESATADDDSRPAMAGVFFDMGPSGTQLVGTDARKLVIAGIKTADGQGSFILHRKACSVLKAVLSRAEADSTVTAMLDASYVRFTIPGYTLLARLVTAKYPNYRSILPKGSESEISLNRKDLMDMVSRISVCADRSSSLVKFQLAAGGLSAEAQDLGFCVSAHDKMEADYQGPEMTIGFNAKHLLEVIASLSCNILRIQFNGAKRAVLFTPSREEEAIAEKAILMPLALE